MTLLPKPNWIRAVLGLAFFIALYLGYWAVYHFSREAHATWFGDTGIRGGEDRAVEWLGTLGFFGACVFSVLTWLRLRPVPGRTALYFLGLGFFYFVCAGEEVSWGQRIFGWETPASFEEHNEQGETNLHNLENLPLHPKDIVSWFMKLFGIGLPVIFFFAFRGRDHRLRRCVAPLSLVPLFIFVEVFNKLDKVFMPLALEIWDPGARRLVRNQHEEIMEMYWGLCVFFAAVGLYLFWRRKDDDAWPEVRGGAG